MNALEPTLIGRCSVFPRRSETKHRPSRRPLARPRLAFDEGSMGRRCSETRLPVGGGRDAAHGRELVARFDPRLLGTPGDSMRAEGERARRLDWAMFGLPSVAGRPKREDRTSPAFTYEIRLSRDRTRARPQRARGAAARRRPR